MTRPVTFVATLGALSLVCGVAAADDAAAKRHYRTAIKHWRDPDPSTTAKHLERAIEAADSKLLRLTLYLIYGQFHQGKTGQFDKARRSYEKVLGGIEGKTTDPRLLRLKGNALLGQGSIIYTETFDAKQALPRFVQAYEVYPSPQTADTLSQLYMRMARAKGTTADERRKHMEVSLQMARDALRLDAKRQRRMQAWTAKLRLQHVIVLTALGKAEEAKAEHELIDTKHFSGNTLYQEALLLALQKAKPENVGAKLREGLAEKVRPGARARNQLRGLIRTEPDFQPFLKRPDWKDLVTDEPLPAPKPAEKPDEKPASRPAGKLGE